MKRIEIVEFELHDGHIHFARDCHSDSLSPPERELTFFNCREMRRKKNSRRHNPAPVVPGIAIIRRASKHIETIDGTFMEVGHFDVFQRP